MLLFLFYYIAPYPAARYLSCLFDQDVTAFLLPNLGIYLHIVLDLLTELEKRMTRIQSSDSWAPSVVIRPGTRQ